MTNAEIQVGEYVRTKNKGIKRIDRIEDNKTVNKYLYFIGYDHNDKEYGVIKATEVLRHSFGIKDLIEAGDYINGDKVELSRDGVLYVVCNYLGGIGGRTLEGYYTYVQDMKEEDIETIVTYEQFAQMEYKVGGEDE